MAYDAFIKIDGIEGESADERHAGWIEIRSYDWTVSQMASRTASTAGGASVERADFSPFFFSKLLDKASPGLACANGIHIGTIVVELCRAGGDKFRFIVHIHQLHDQ
jgi:type VI secretion system secreted protein Hcp